MPSSKYDLSDRRAFHIALAAGKTLASLGFHGSEGDVQRFIARYRLARSFRGLLLDDYGQATIDGYAAIFRLFLAWSAFERLLEIIGVEQKQAHVLFDAHNVAGLCDRIAQSDNRKSFYSFIRDHTRTAVQAEIDQFLSGNVVDSVYLAAAIRHVFAHGKLSPHANRTIPRKVVRICDDIADFLLRAMDEEFSRRVRQDIARGEA
jgi:hypothetical protein